MKTRQDLITRATEDAAFREQLKADPRGTVEREFGVPLPGDYEITVVEETPRRACIVLPMRESELSEEELASLSAGGRTESFGCSLFVPPDVPCI